jgi:hypothetical protein
MTEPEERADVEDEESKISYYKIVENRDGSLNMMACSPS